MSGVISSLICLFNNESKRQGCVEAYVCAALTDWLARSSSDHRHMMRNGQTAHRGHVSPEHVAALTILHPRGLGYERYLVFCSTRLIVSGSSLVSPLPASA